jgi:hypothetical protein
VTRVFLQFLAILAAALFCSIAAFNAFENAARPIGQRDGSDPAMGQVSNTSQSIIPNVQLRPISDFPETLARPVFYEGRQFPKAAPRPEPAQPEPMQNVAPPAEPVAAGPGAEQLRLLGVRIVGDKKNALLAVAEGEARWYAETESVNDWLVQAVHANEVVLSRGVEKVILSLYLAQSKD